MTTETLLSESPQKPLRMWPALVRMAIIVLCRYVPWTNGAPAKAKTAGVDAQFRVENLP